MRVLRSPAAVSRLADTWRSEGLRTALVPTMGALHEGHLALIRAARRRADKTIVSVFVNPTQFGPHEDLAAYPRDLARDRQLCAREGVDLIFAPTPRAMYAPDFSTWVEEHQLADHLCGLRRPVHFRGVCTVVLKLFNICRPNMAVFGQKDAQQSLVIERMVRDLNVPVKIVVHPTVREADGLAMSSRNAYLTAAQRSVAPRIYQALSAVPCWRAEGATIAVIRRRLRARVRRIPGARIDYVSIADEDTLDEVRAARRGQQLLVAVAVFLGRARLIDNIRLRW
jgi:pantoate--beta-alanine ligase